MRSSSLVIVALALAVALAGCSQPIFGDENATPSADAADSTDENVTATFVTDEGNATVSLEVADTSEERERGLMYRQSLPDDHGMVFVYDDADDRSFWMKNTYVPLDMIFVAPDGTVSNVEHAEPEPNTSTADLERYESDGPAQYVVELERGFANRTGVDAGSEIVFHDDLHDR